MSSTFSSSAPAALSEQVATDSADILLRSGAAERQEKLVAGARMVARRAQLTIFASDVRAAYLKASAVVSPARGEFIEDARLVGEDTGVSADLTIRVEAARLPAVLEELRGVGRVENETLSGDDVTEQAVDLDARLRNEREVEEELVELLETRKDASLTDLLKLRESLAAVRGSIEKLAGQRETLGGQVLLAKVLVLIRVDQSPGKPEAKKKEGLLDLLTGEVTAAARVGTEQLVRSIARITEAVIANLVLWLVLLLLTPPTIGLARRLFHASLVVSPPHLGNR